MTVDNLAALLHAREEELSAIYENVPGIVFYIAVEPDGEFRFVSVSRDFLTATGLSREQAVGSLVRNVIPPPSLDMVLNRYREAIRSGQPVRWEEKSVYPAGQKYGEVAVTPLYDANGLATHLIGIVHDITEHKRLEQRRAEDLLEAAPDAMVVVDQAGRMILVNAQTERLFGYSRQEILGRNVELLIPPRFHERHQEHRIRFFSQPRRRPMGPNLQLSGLRKDGTEFPVEISLSPIQTSEGTLVTGAIRDITERKLAEEALRASEERLRLAQWAAHVGTFDLNLQTGVDIWQPETEALYGLPAGGFGGTLTAFENLIHPDDRGKIVKLTQEMMKTGQPTEGEWRIVWPDGSLHWIASRGQVFMDESGEPARMLGVNMDITERKLVEEELVRTNERLHLAIEAGSAGGWDYDRKTGKNIWFGNAHAQLGMTPEETPGSVEEFWDRVHEDDRERLKHAILTARDKHEVFAEDFRVVWRDGTTHWLRSRGHYHYSPEGEPQRMFGISLDITESKQAEQALRTSEERFRLAVQAGKMYSFDWDPVTDVVVRSPERLKVLGDAEPLRFTHKQFMEKVHPDDRAQFTATIAGLTPENPTAEAIYRVVSDDAVVWLRSSGRAFFDGKNNLQRVIGIVSDITDLKLAEDALAGMTRKLIESQEQERARIGRELHDDINQRLAMLSVELEQIQDSPAEVKGRVQEIRNRMAQISDDVQALSHDLHSSKLEYLGVVAGIRSWCREFSQRQKMAIDFTSDVSSVVPAEVGLSLLRVVQEASHNAMKHSGVGRIELQLRQESNEIHLIVTDTGKGFDLEQSERGKGLGLTSMRERVRLLNGTISIESKPMAGTTIHIRVPLEPTVRPQRVAG